jgi:hypothetical protein
MLGSGDVTAMATAMAMVIATRVWMVMGMSNGKVITESCNERKEA